MNINILLQEPKIEKQVKITIEPLAPLSIVSDIPGTYYKAQNTPDKYKLCGVFENILGWHFSKNDRTKISKKIKEFNHKKLKNKSYYSSQSNSGFQPLLYDFFEIGMTFTNHGTHYNDLWKRSFSRMDADVHAKGSPNLDYPILREKHNALKSEDLLSFFKKNKSSFPMFYTSPTLREYIDYAGEQFQIKLTMDTNLYSLLAIALTDNSTAYLGNNEGWVEIKIEEI